MASKTWTIILVVLVCLLQTVYSYSCTYINRSGALIYLRCPYSECCGHHYYRYCCSNYNVGGIVGGVIGLLVFVGLIAGCVACFFCACCPVYQRRQAGYIYSRGVPDYRSTVTTAHVSSQPYQSTQVTRAPGNVYTTSPPPQYKP